MRNFFLVLVLLSTFVIFGCGGGSDPGIGSDSGNAITETRDLTAEIQIYDNAYSYLSVMIDGARVECNGQDTGTTNSDGYSLLHYSVPVETSYFFANDCTVYADGYYSSWAQISFDSYPPPYSIGLSKDPNYTAPETSPTDTTSTDTTSDDTPSTEIGWIFKVRASVNVYNQSFIEIPAANVSVDFGSFGTLSGITNEDGYVVLEKTYQGGNSCTGNFSATASVTKSGYATPSSETVTSYFFPSADREYCQAQLNFTFNL